MGTPRNPSLVGALADDVARTREACDSAFADRHEPGGETRWRDCAAEAGAARSRFESYVDQIEQGLRSSTSGSIEQAVAFLEADVWCFRSGYAKGRLMRRLKQCELSTEHRAALTRIALRYVELGGRGEFREATRLARVIGGAELRTGLRDRLHSGDPGMARRALLMLVSLRRPQMSSHDVEVARAVVSDELQRTTSWEFGNPMRWRRIAQWLASPTAVAMTEPPAGEPGP